MDGVIERRLAAALFAFLALAVSHGTSMATGPTCATGQYADNYGVCQDACKAPYTGGIEFLSGEQRGTRYCMGGGSGVTVVSGGGTPPTSNPYCWHYVGTLKETGYNSDGSRYEDYSLYTTPRDICNNVGAKECGKLGCDLVEGGANPLAANISSTGKVAPEIAGVLSKVVPTVNYGTGQYWEPGGTVTGGSAASEFCGIYGYNYNGTLCQFDSVSYSMVPKTGTSVQVATADDILYTPSPSDVNCVYDYSGSSPILKSGTCAGTFWTKFDPAAQIAVCKAFKGNDYNGPMPEGYNPAAASVTTVCLLSASSPYQRPVAGSRTNNGYGTQNQPYVTAPNFYACEYTLARSANKAGTNAPTLASSSNAFVYRATGNACGTIGAVNASGSSTGGNTGAAGVAYKPGAGDLYCDNGKIQTGWDFAGTPAKCTGDYVGAGGVESANHYFGGAGGGFVRVGNGGQLSVVSSGDGAVSEVGGYTVNNDLVSGSPSAGTSGSVSAPGGSSSLDATAQMPSTTFSPWYTAKYSDGPKGVWQTRIAAVKSSKLGTWVEGFKVTAGTAYVPRLQFDFFQYHVNWTLPPEIMSALRVLVLVSAALAARKIIFGG